MTLPDCSLLQAPRTRGQAVAVELKRRVLLREVNTRIREVSDRFGTPEGFYRMICECGADGCDERLMVPVAAYESLRSQNEFLVCAAHKPPAGAPVALMPALVPADPLRLQ